MNYKRLIKKSFSKVVPLSDNESFIKSITERTLQMENRKSITFKKPAVAVCAVIAALSLGITAAAATGILNFNEIFGNRIRTENEELGESLIGNAENVKWTTSDEDYIVNLKGVTGTDESVIAVIEIARADGEAAEKYFLNTSLLGETCLTGICDCVKVDDGFESNIGFGSSYQVNERGNIELVVELYESGGDYTFSGKKIYLSGNGFYPAKHLYKGESSNLKTVFFNDSYQGVTAEEQEYLDSISVLSLKWSAEFVYMPSEAAVEALSCEKLDVKGVLYTTVRKAIINENGEWCNTETVEENAECEVTFDKLEVSSTKMTMSGSYKIEEYDKDSFYYMYMPFNSNFIANEIYLIKKDGSNSDIKARFSTGDYRMDDDGTYHFSHGLEFYAVRDGSYGPVAVNLSEISSISINGTIYELS